MAATTGFFGTVTISSMNSEYDPGAGFKESEDLMARIKGARFIPVHGLGNFPMTEDFAAMKRPLMPVFEEITARSRR